MAGSREESPAQDTGPEGIRLPEVGAEIKHAQFAHVVGQTVDCRPSTRHQMQYREESDQSSSHINNGLYDIGPNHGREAAFKRIEHSQGCDDRNGGDLARS